MNPFIRRFRIALLLFASSACASSTPDTASEPKRPPTLEAKKLEPLHDGEMAPVFRLPTLNPEVTKLKLFVSNQYVGADAGERKRILLLSFAESICGPCKIE